jgi:epoxyqueuosine reductase QueG
MTMQEGTGLEKWIEETIREFFKSGENTLRNENSEPAWAEPLIGFSRGDDPLYEQLKSMIGQFCWTPIEIFRLAFPASTAGSGDLSVISWILPQTEATKADNRKETRFGSERWVRARKFGEEFNIKLRNRVVDLMMNEGYEAVAPSNSSFFAVKVSERYGMASTWSERHAAHVSGLGTFGLCDGLITRAGKAVRCGSIVARIQLTPTSRPYGDHHAYCLHYTKGTCGACIKRCPVGAITSEGHDKKRCREYVEGPISSHARDTYGVEAYGCGLCQTKVPCESAIPRALMKK